MRSRLALFASFALWGVLGSAISEPTAALGSDRKAGNVERPLGVEELMRHVTRHRGRVLVEGIVSGPLPERGGVGLIDVREFEECGVTTCAPLTLPVHWSGKLPAMKERVLARGRVQKVGGKLAFVASSLEIVSEETAAGPAPADSARRER